MASIEFLHCNKTYDDGTQALRDFSLSVEDGEFMVLVGPSGCGKSTCLRLLAGLDQLSGGDILIDGESVIQTQPQQRNIAMVFQNYALYPHMSVYDNLAFPLKMAKQTKIDIRESIEEIADMLQLHGLLQRKPKQLSGGQRQRVAMGRAIVRRPRVFLMDEPLSNLDAKLRVQIRADIAALQKRLGVTTLYVTHDQTEAMSLGHRVTVLKEGEILQTDKPDQLYSQPCSTFVAGFIGNPGMNIMHATLTRQADQCNVMIGEHTFTLYNQPQQSAFEASQIQVGIRPEHFYPSKALPALPVTCVNIESLGYEKIVYCRAHWQADQLLTMRVHSTSYTIGDTLRLAFNPEHVYFFDNEGGRRR